jgi:putative GTP pyrophosphokinase
MSGNLFDFSGAESFLASNPELLGRFIIEAEDLARLCDEIKYILQKRLRENGVEFAALTSRIKTLKSFTEKLSRKNYSDPFGDVADRAGVRLVFLFTKDQQVIGEIIEREFEVIERIDKSNTREAERYGYDAVHYVVKLGSGASGVRCEGLKEFVCEIQTRTVLQDAWAVIDHHLFYKKSSSAPPFLKKQMNSLAGFIEAADNNFEVIRQERDRYQEELGEIDVTEKAFRSQGTNGDTVKKLLKSKFQQMVTEKLPGHMEIVLTPQVIDRYPRIEDVDSVLNRTETARVKYYSKSEWQPVSAIGQLAIAIALDFKAFRETGWDDRQVELFDELESLVER